MYAYAIDVYIYIYRKGNPGRPPHGCFTSPNDPSTSARMITGTNGNGINGVLGSHRLQAFNPCTLYSQEGPTGFPLPPFPEIYVYIYVCIYGWSPPPPPKISTRLFHTIPQVASLHWSTTHICRKHCRYRCNRAFRHVHANRAATSRGLDMCINLAPNLGRRFMIVYVLDKLKCCFAFCSVLRCAYSQHASNHNEEICVRVPSAREASDSDAAE